MSSCAPSPKSSAASSPLPFASTVYILAEALLAFGSEAQREALLPGIACGEVIGSLAVSEQRGITGPARMLAAVRSGRLRGTKMPVTDGDVATHAIVAAGDEAGPGLFLVDLSAEGVDRHAIDTLDPTRSAARIMFEDVPCERLGAGGQGMALLSILLDRAAVLLAFEQVGGADRCLETARDYALQRFAFGRAIGSYQAIKHKLADIYVRNQLARSSAYHGAWALSTGAAALPQAASAARIAGTQAYNFAAKESLHTHGGIGFTWEMDCHIHLRRARQLALVLGGLPVWRERLVQSLERRRTH